MDEFMRAVADAESAVEDLPKHLQPVAFEKALTWLLRDSPEAADAPKISRGDDTGGAETPAATGALVEGLPPAHVVAEATSRLKLAWAVVVLHARGEEATTASVRQLIKDELSQTPPLRPDASKGLRALTPRYLKREKVGRGYTYQPGGRVLDLFEGTDG